MIVVSDNGIGFPPGWQVESPNTLGLQLVGMLTRQLWGTLTVDTGGVGSTFTVRFTTCKEPSGARRAVGV